MWIAGIGDATGEFPFSVVLAYALPGDAVLFEELLGVFVSSDIGG